MPEKEDLDFDFEDDEFEGEGDKKPEEETPAPKKQSSKENARFKQMRLEQEQKEREKESYVKGKIEGIGVNSFTGQPLTSKYDLEIYEIQKRLEKEGKDPLTDLPAEIARVKTEEEEIARKALEEKNAIKLRAEKDLQEFYDQGGTKEEMDEFLSKMAKPEWKDIFGDSIEKGYISPTKAFKAMKKIEGDAAKDVKAKQKQVPPNPAGSQKVSKSIKDMTDDEINKLWKERYGK